MTCLVCDHPNRFRLEAALKAGTPKARVAKDFLISRPKLYDHIRQKHEAKSPAKPDQVQEDPTNRDEPDLTDELVKDISNRRDRLSHIERLISDRRFDGTKTIAKLARLWRPWLREKAEVEVADLVAEAARRHRIKRGAKDVRKELLIVELLSLKEKCVNSGDYKTAASLLAQYAELDNLKDDPSAVHRQIIAQFVQIVQVGAPHLLPHIQEVTARLEEGYEQAKAIVEGEALPQIAPLPEAEPMQEAPPTPRCEESSNPGIDTGIPRSGEPSSEA